EGSFVVVSHNRHFVSQVANKIWYIEDKQIKEYPGTYDEYEYWRKQQAAVIAPVKTQVTVEPKIEKKQEAPKSDNNQNRLKSLEKEMKKVEADLETLQKQKEAIELKMTDPAVFGNFNELQKLQQELVIVNQKLETANKKWDELAETIDTL
ncbi:MAG: ABC transporter ATP-binding protein, partial [Cytophagia bacterium]|nr:ABC transporter ATP-binding protein [Cytophagia bacterium]